MKKREFDPSVFIAEGARIVGNVTLGKNCSVWFNAVLRADNQPIIVGDGSNVQDNAVLHMSEKYPLTIGKNVTIGHGAIVHGCVIEDNCIIGMGAIIMNGAHIGKNCIIGAATLITEGKDIPDNSIVVGSPYRILREASEKDIARITRNAEHYVELSRQYM